MKVLLVNDDGYDALGICSLFEALSNEDAIVIAPSVEQSAKGHSFTMHTPLFLTEVSNNQFHLSGTPADCTYFGLNNLCPDVDVVLSGINMGANLGTDVYYSGTVAGAREGFLKGKLSIACSVLENVKYQHPEQRRQVYQRAAQLTVQLLEQIRKNATGPQLWNINFPASSMLSEDLPQICVKPLGHRRYQSCVHERTDPRGRTYYWIGGPPEDMEASDTDVYWCTQGYVVMTPLQLDCTDYGRLTELSNWQPTFTE